MKIWVGGFLRVRIPEFWAYGLQDAALQAIGVTFIFLGGVWGLRVTFFLFFWWGLGFRVTFVLFSFCFFRGGGGG